MLALMVAKIFYVLFVTHFSNIGSVNCEGALVDNFGHRSLLAYFGKLLLVPGAGI